MLLFLLAALLAQPKPPPAHLVVPESVKKARTPGTDAGPVPLFALGAPDVLAALGPLVPEPGAWAEYAVRVKGQPDTRLRISILPPALDGGRLWLELVSITGIGQEVGARLLVHGGLMRTEDVERAIVSSWGQAPIEVPIAQLRDQLGKKPAPKEARITVQELPPGEVTVPAGKFRARSLRITKKGEPPTRLWRSSEVPVWGLVRAESALQSMELLSSGHTGAHSVIAPGYGEAQETAADAGAAAQGNGSDKVK